MQYRTAPVKRMYESAGFMMQTSRVLTVINISKYK